ncbi:MAG TPA: hypothetical protein VFL16_12220 [Steroidobacteraceae bacterium]|nr:hypothetical protein [Steroidobacteraceae bacterium]
MSEWIDFAVYATQLIVCVLVTARWAAQFKSAVVADRNPEWARAHPQVLSGLERFSGLNLLIQAWAIFSVLVLLAWRLDLEPTVLKTPGMPGWRSLLATAYLLLGIGFVLLGLGAIVFTRWLRSEVPLGEQRRASLTPRSVDGFVPRGLKFAIYALVAVAIAARPIASLIYPGRVTDVRQGSIFALATTFMLFLAVGISVRRRPNVFDRVLGTAFRRREVRVCLALLAFNALGLVTLVALEVAGIDGRRYSGVVFSAFVTAMLAALMPFPRRNDADAQTPAHAA